jgi:effector-binding domain-containing protein
LNELFEKEQHMNITEPKIEERAEVPYMGIRTQISMQDMGTGIIPQLHDEVRAWLDKQGLSPSGAPFIRYWVINMPGMMDIELGWPVASRLAGTDRIQPGVLPAGRYAMLLYTGDYSGLMEANRVLIDWAKENGIAWDNRPIDAGDAFGARFETYFIDPGNEPDPAKWETEVAIRLAD